MLLPKAHFVLYYFTDTSLSTYKTTFEEGSHNTEKQGHATPHEELISIPKCSSYGPHYFSVLLFSESKSYPIFLLFFPVFL